MMHDLSLFDFCEPWRHLSNASRLHLESLISLCTTPKLLRPLLCPMKYVVYRQATSIVNGTWASHIVLDKVLLYFIHFHSYPVQYCEEVIIIPAYRNRDSGICVFPNLKQ